jgi:hypothetical protein
MIRDDRGKFIGIVNMYWDDILKRGWAIFLGVFKMAAGGQHIGGYRFSGGGPTYFRGFSRWRRAI